MNPNKAVDFILEHAPEYAKAKAERVYIEEYRKSLKAILFQQSDGKTISDREAYAYSHQDYLTNLAGLKEAVEAEETMRWKLVAAQARIEIWRSTEATSRAAERMFK